MMSHFSMKGIALSVLVAMTLTGCGNDRMSQAEQAMAAIRDESSPPIEPLPQAQPVEDFVYSAASDTRSPFLPLSLINMQAKSEEASGVRPDLEREREPLEAYELAELIYRGIVVAPDGKEYGLVQMPNGVVRDVRVGEYMGKNHGRVLEITPTQINLEEIVPDSRVGFVHQKAALVTP